MITIRIAAQRDYILVSSHVPHAAAPDAAKGEFWANLAAEVRRQKRTGIVLVDEDLNVKLGGRRPGEGRWLGPHMGPHRPEGGLQGPDGVEDSRQRMITFVQEADLVPMNTCFRQPSSRPRT